MIAREPKSDEDVGSVLNHDLVVKLMDRGARRAIEEARRRGVPIPVDGEDGAIRYELPDGTIVDEDPWHGKSTAPDGWYERFGITPEQTS